MTLEPRADPYAPPRASLEVARAPARESLFFTASPLKLGVMSVMTFNFYILYWFWMNFRAIRERESSDTYPFWRAFFSVLWAYACFRRQGEAAPGGPHRRASAVLAVAYFATGIVSLLPDPYWLVSLLDFFLLLPANSWARAANLAGEPALEENDRFTAANWLGIALGATLMVLVLAGTFFAEGA